MSTKVGRSYVYNGICDVCGFKKKSYEVFPRWDGYMVCKEDWETRNLADFYDTPNDTHLLPWTRPDDNDVEKDMIPLQGTGWTVVFGTGGFTVTGMYTLDVQNRILHFQVLTQITGTTTVASAGGRFVTTAMTAAYPVIAGSMTIRTVSANGTLLSVQEGQSIINAGTFPAQNASFTVSGYYSY